MVRLSRLLGAWRDTLRLHHVPPVSAFTDGADRSRLHRLVIRDRWLIAGANLTTLVTAFIFSWQLSAMAGRPWFGHVHQWWHWLSSPRSGWDPSSRHGVLVGTALTLFLATAVGKGLSTEEDEEGSLVVLMELLTSIVCLTASVLTWLTVPASWQGDTVAVVDGVMAVSLALLFATLGAVVRPSPATRRLSSDRLTRNRALLHSAVQVVTEALARPDGVAPSRGQAARNAWWTLAVVAAGLAAAVAVPAALLSAAVLARRGDAPFGPWALAFGAAVWAFEVGAIVFLQWRYVESATARETLGRLYATVKWVPLYLGATLVGSVVLLNVWLQAGFVALLYCVPLLAFPICAARVLMSTELVQLLRLRALRRALAAAEADLRAGRDAQAPERHKVPGAAP